jgi:hypothetical protein
VIFFTADFAISGNDCPEVFGEHFLAVFVDFAEPDCPESCALSGKGESADAAEEVEVGRFIHKVLRGVTPEHSAGPRGCRNSA